MDVLSKINLQSQSNIIAGGIPENVLQDMENAFSSDPKNKLAQNVCFMTNPRQVMKSQSDLRDKVHIFNCKVHLTLFCVNLAQSS